MVEILLFNIIFEYPISDEICFVGIARKQIIFEADYTNTY